ncbi:hypothetical protein B9Z55_019940 [Caenorhabditis nigoni]|uniref:C-type lectin domain-containing protein n=1 Tax=Caenorhabditis nigoni TaxID=1611254 RepID=A0A2G5TKN4_9PELO|nr:hypothetical protein B9Z55_019940 [Caenorhabditis nigoni]
MIFFSVVCYFLSIFGTANSDCAPGDIKNPRDNCVHVENLPSTWQEAENFCTAHNGHLASVHNAFDMTSLRKVGQVCTNFWIGGQCQSGSNCKWSDGTTFDYTNFRNGNSGTENCILADTKSGTWSTQPCDTKSCIACEIKGAMQNCQDWMKAGFTDSGKYTILVNGVETEVWCDMQTYGGGWVLFQNRLDDTESYWDRKWDEYKNGFGDIDENSNFWLGNEALYQLTNNQKATLRVEMYGDRTPNSKNTTDFWFGHYFEFKVGPESQNYPLLNLEMNWANPIGNASTAWYDLTCSIGSPFSTVDNIHDPVTECVTKFQMGGWWLKNCALSTLNGAYTPKDWNNGYGMFWIWDGSETILHPRKTRMLVRQTVD